MPPKVAPSGYPIDISDTLRLRRRVFENSAATAFIEANMPPIPRPVTTRQIDRVTGLVAVVAMNIPNAITTRQPRVVGRRPILSLTPPSAIEPIIIPISSIDRTIPSAPAAAWLSRPHSRAMPFDAKLIERMSYPSSAFSAIVMPMTMICSRLIGAVAITSLGSILTGGPPLGGALMTRRVSRCFAAGHPLFENDQCRTGVFFRPVVRGPDHRGFRPELDGVSLA